MPREAVRRARPMASGESAWRRAPFFCVQTELSPMMLYGCQVNSLTCFAGLAEQGLGAPTYVAYATRKGVRVFPAGAALDPAPMSECWVLVWFAGAKGWSDWDSPWAVFLQNRPKAMALDDQGLHVTFAGPAGLAALMPLYGYYKPPQPGKEVLAAQGLPEQKIRTGEWTKRLPDPVLKRVRYWANVSREFPLYCEDSFSIDRGADAVILRQRFRWQSIDDAWDTPHRKLAPLSPPLALAYGAGKFPVQLPNPPTDPQLFTPYGPYTGIEGTDTYDAVFPVLQYVNETEAFDPPRPEAHPAVAAALEKLQATARAKFPRPDRYFYDHGGMNNFCWAVMGDLWYAKGLPYYDETTRAYALASLK
jgi:hypothetical protein